jgi:drug/metabolite transporter (DMT)-like permease
LDGELWIWLTVAAAFLQNVRSALQKSLTTQLSTAGATYCRFLYALPFALVYACWAGGASALPALGSRFTAFCVIGGTAQILGTLALVASFSYRNFAVATAYSKTETVQTALFGIVLLGDAVTPGAALAIVISLAGVLALTTRPGQPILDVLAAVTARPALLGIASGAAYGVAAVCYRAASLSVEGARFDAAAAVTLAAVIGFQTLAMGIGLLLRDRAELARVLAAWRRGAAVGLAGMSASVGWFTAMTLQNAAYVRALGQIELVFTFAASSLLFGERSTRREVTGVALVVAGILLLLTAA